MRSSTSVQKLFALAMLLLIIAYFLNILVFPFTVPYLDFLASLYGEDKLLEFDPNISYAIALALTLQSAVHILVAGWIFKKAKREKESPIIWVTFALFYGVFSPIALYLKVMAKKLHTFKINPSQSINQKKEYTFPEVSIPKISGVAVFLLLMALLATQLGATAPKLLQIWLNLEGAIQVVNYTIVETATTFNTLILLGCLNILAAIWIFKEARGHSENAVAWAFLTVFFGIFAIAALFLVVLANELDSSKISFHSPDQDLEQIQNDKIADLI